MRQRSDREMKYLSTSRMVLLLGSKLAHHSQFFAIPLCSPFISADGEMGCPDDSPTYHRTSTTHSSGYTVLPYPPTLCKVACPFLSFSVQFLVPSRILMETYHVRNTIPLPSMIESSNSAFRYIPLGRQPGTIRLLVLEP